MKFSKFILVFSFIFIQFQISFSEEDKEKITSERIIELINLLGHQNYKTRESALKLLVPHSFDFSELLIKKLDETEDIEIKERIEYILKHELENVLNKKFNLAKTLYQQKKYKEAINILFKINQIKIKNIFFNLFLDYCREANENEKAIQILKKVLVDIQNNKLDPIAFELDEEYILIELIKFNNKNQDYKSALNYSNTLRTKSAHLQETDALHTLVLELNKKLEEAERFLIKALDENIDKGNNILNLASFYIRNEKTQKLNELLTKQMGKFSGSLEGTNSENNVLISLQLLIYSKEYSKASELINKTLSSFFKAIDEKKKFSIEFDLGTFDIFYMILNAYVEHKLNSFDEEKYKNWYLALKEESQKTWPAPLLGFVSGSITEEELYTFAQAETPFKNDQNLCEAYCYSGIRFLIDKKYDQAKKAFKNCIDKKIHNFIEPTLSHFILNTEEKVLKPSKDQ